MEDGDWGGGMSVASGECLRSNVTILARTLVGGLLGILWVVFALGWFTLMAASAEVSWMPQPFVSATRRGLVMLLLSAVILGLCGLMYLVAGVSGVFAASSITGALLGACFGVAIQFERNRRMLLRRVGLRNSTEH